MTSIRPFVDSDIDAVVALWDNAGLTRPWNDPRADVARKLVTQRETFFVGDENGTIVGTVMAGYDGHRGWIHYLAVAGSHRGRGVGRALVERAEQALEAMGCPKVQLQIRPDNAEVADFYNQLGYSTYEAISMGKRIVKDGPEPRVVQRNES